MNEIRTKLQNDIVEPAALSRSTTMQEGIVIKSDQKANTCDVSFIRNDGKKITQDNVPLLLNGTTDITWFPKKDEKVILQTREENVFIIGPSYRNFQEIRNKMKLKHDIFSDSNTDTLGGFLF